MGQYNVIHSSKEQAGALFEKHLRPYTVLKGFFNKRPIIISRIVKTKFAYDSEDNIGFVTLFTNTGKKISYQLRGEYPCFIQFTGFGDTRYDIAYAEKLNQDLYLYLKEQGIKVRQEFWKGSEI